MILLAALGWVLAAAAIAALVTSVPSHRRVLEARDASLKLLGAHLENRDVRVRFLELQLDEIRAETLRVTAPPIANTGRFAEPEIAPELRAELEEIDDPESRAEFEALIRHRMQNDPHVSALQLRDELFGSAIGV